MLMLPPQVRMVRYRETTAGKKTEYTGRAGSDLADGGEVDAGACGPLFKI